MISTCQTLNLRVGVRTLVWGMARTFKPLPTNNCLEFCIWFVDWNFDRNFSENSEKSAGTLMLLLKNLFIKQLYMCKCSCSKIFCMSSSVSLKQLWSCFDSQFQSVVPFIDSYIEVWLGSNVAIPFPLLASPSCPPQRPQINMPPRDLIEKIHLHRSKTLCGLFMWS